jgi:hypothetical protein
VLKGAALAGGLDARLELVEDLQGAVVSGGSGSGWHSIKSGAEMFVDFSQAPLFQQQLGKVRRSLQFKQGGGLAFRAVDR